MNFLPVLGGAWFILPAAWRGRFLGWLWLFGLLWTLPIAIYYSEMAKWFWLLASRQGAYGSGEVGLLNLSEWLRHLKDLGMSHGFWLMGLAGCLMLWPKWWRERHNPPSQLAGSSRLAVGLGLAGTVQWLLSAKWGYRHYLIPALGVMGLQWVVLHQMLHQWGGGRFLRRAGPLLLGAVLMATPFTQVWVWRAARQKADAQLQLVEWVRTRSAGALVLTYGASSPLLALMFGSTFSGHHLKYLIARQFERHGVEVFFYTYESGRLCSWDRFVSWQQVVRRHDAILMHGTQLTPAQMRLLPAEMRVEYLGGVSGECVYQLRLQGLRPSGGAAETTYQSPD